MRILSSPAELTSELSKLIHEYSRFSCAVAWAGSGFPLETLLRKHRNKMEQVVVGTHFFQTHPDFIDRYRRNSKVRFVLETKGVFHPKLYYFENSPDDWACVVGSPNFTHGAFHANMELAVAFNSGMPDSAKTRFQLLAFQQVAWNQAKSVTAAWLKNYRIAWARNVSRRAALGAPAATGSPPVVAPSAGALGWSWRDYLTRVTADPHHDFSERLAILRIFRSYFEKFRRFCRMNEEQRKQIAGLAEDSGHMWRYFGSMKGAGRFKSAVKKNDLFLSRALDSIPLRGSVLQSHFRRFQTLLQSAFPAGGCKIGVASRLLAMKRPDLFLCVDGPNRENVAADFGATNARLRTDFDFYWTEVVERIQETEWWCEPPPSRPFEKRIWEGRAALLDAVYYDPSAKIGAANNQRRIFVVGCDELTHGAELMSASIEWNLPMAAKKDDLVLMYRTAPTSAIKDIWRITGPFTRYQVGNKGGFRPGRQGGLTRVAALKKPITYDELRRDKTTKGMAVVRKRFQGKTDVTSDWSVLYEKIIFVNPASLTALYPYRPAT